MSGDERALVAIIPEWLAASQGADIPTGLSREEALRRAWELRRLLREGKVSPSDVDLDEDLKDVLHALVALLGESGTETPEAFVREADAVYQCLRRIKWPGDELGERQDLLVECAEIGWAGLGLRPEDVDRRRRGVSQATADSCTGPSPFRTSGSITMPETARILQFPRRQTWPLLSAEESRAAALRYLGSVPAGRTEDFKEAFLSSPDVLFALSVRLHDVCDSSPTVVAYEAEDAYAWLVAPERQFGLFDERDYLLGDLALIATGANRLLGKRGEAEVWLERAEAAFRHTVNPTPSLTNVAYARLALRFQTRRFQEVLELIPSLVKSYERLGMVRELAKSCFLEAMCLKQCSRDSEAFDKFRLLASSLERSGADHALLGHVLIEIGGYCAANGQSDDALREYRRAAELLTQADRPMALAHLKVTIGETLRGEGKLGDALSAFRSAVESYLQLEMTTFVAYTRLFVADVLLSLDQAREAEWEILAALPTIEEQKMVPEGFAAVALLKESVRRRTTDPNALRELREHLQAKKA